MVSGYEARISLWVWRLDFGAGNGLGEVNRMVYDTEFGRRPSRPDGDCTMAWYEAGIGAMGGE